MNTKETSRSDKKYQQWLKRNANKPTAKELAEIKKLEREALPLWRKVVKLQAGGKCKNPPCKKTKRLNCHHIESYSTNKTLRYDPQNGMLLCSTDHKFGRTSAHKSFCFVYELLINEPGRVAYLRNNYKVKTEITKEFLVGAIEGLKKQIEFLKPKKGLLRRRELLTE